MTDSQNAPSTSNMSGDVTKVTKLKVVTMADGVSTATPSRLEGGFVRLTAKDGEIAGQFNTASTAALAAQQRIRRLLGE